LLYFSGWFEQDNMPKQRRSWLHLVNPSDGVYTGNFYYGQITENGTREGEGTLYSAEAGDDANFMDCVMSGKPYTKERLVCEACRSKDPSMLCLLHKELDMHHLKYLVYDGQWHQNLPHGVGVQFYPDVSNRVGGVYYGDFKQGSRHGRGTWQVRDKSFTYMPLPKKKRVHNWKDDMMHGVANVEDSKYVHDNVVYADNKTMMPFTSVGPPQTKFDHVAGWNIVFKGVRAASHQRKKREKSAAAPKSSMAASAHGATNQRRLSKVSKGSDQGVWGHDDTKILQNAAKHHGKLGAEQFRTDAEDEVDLLVREPTELVQHVEDMLVLGGTGENAAMNGLYFKVTKSFGHSLWRMAKQDSMALGLWTTHHQRYMYKDDSKRSRIWIIGPTPLTGLQKGPGCAFAEETVGPDSAVAESGPHAVRSGWNIWSPAQSMMAKPKDLDADADDETKGSVDTITVQSIVGFTINDEDMPALNGRLFVRHGAEFYERPVYVNEAALPEDTTLYLYWFKQGGDLKEGSCKGDGKNIRDEVDASEIFQSGCWAVSSKLGAGPVSFEGEPDDAEHMVAYLNDQAASPYHIAAGARWSVMDPKSGSWTSSRLQLVHQVLQKQSQAMDFFDSSDEDDIDDSD
jgi:hypothetical protein